MVAFDDGKEAEAVEAESEEAVEDDGKEAKAVEAESEGHVGCSWKVIPTPATRLISTLLKAGECIRHSI